MSTTRAMVEVASKNRNVQAFLQVIYACEGTSGKDGYRTLFGGGLFDNGYVDHPNIKVPFRDTYSTAAGAPQFLYSTWKECQAALELPDFSPESQNRAAIYLIYRRGALGDVEAGRIATAVNDCNQEWASLPGSPYGQPVKTLAFCLQVFTDNGGVLSPTATQPDEARGPAPDAVSPTQPKEARMGALAAFLPLIFNLFSAKGTAAVERATGATPDVAAQFLKDIGDKVQALSGITVTDNASAAKAVAAVASDPVKVAALEESAAHFALVEVGGGIGGAREAYQKYVDGLEDDPAWRMVLKFFVNPVHWVTAVFLYYVQQFVPQLALMVPTLAKEAILGLVLTIVGVLAMVGAYWLGTYQQKQKE